MTPSGLRFDVGLPEAPPLARDYLAGDPGALPFYEGWYGRLDSYRKQAREAEARFDRPGVREKAATLIRAPTADAEARLQSFVDRGGYVVTTGQQPGLFTGPLYGIYKALTAVRLAEALQDALSKPVLPVFWIASDDHDWEEMSHTHLIDTRNEVRRIEIEAPNPRSTPPVHRIRLDEELENAIDQLLQLLPDNDFREHYLELLRDSCPKGSTLSQGFRSIMERLLGSYGLLFVDAADPELKRSSLPTLERELRESREGERVLAESRAQLETKGYATQVALLAGGVNLFLEGPDGRERVHRRGDRFRLRRSGREFSQEELWDTVTGDPTILSPNVLLRPVVENALFPVLSYVAGPAEIAYYGQLKSFFRSHGIAMPVIYPRSSVTIVERKIQKVLDKFDIGIQRLATPPHQLAAEMTREETPPAVRKALDRMRGAIGGGCGQLSELVREIDPSLEGPVSRARNQSLRALESVEKKIAQSLKRKNAVALGQLKKAQDHIYPLGGPQERTLNVFHYLVRYGSGFLRQLADRIVVDLTADSG